MNHRLKDSRESVKDDSDGVECNQETGTNDPPAVENRGRFYRQTHIYLNLASQFQGNKKRSALFRVRDLTLSSLTLPKA